MISIPSQCLLTSVVIHLSRLMGETSLGVDSLRLSKRQRWTADETFPCHCRNDTVKVHGLIVVFSGLRLSAVPAGIPHCAVELYLNNNTIKQIPDYVFGDLSSLANLDLSDNMIDYFGANAFTGLKNLRKLSLSNNRLNISKGVLPYSSFSPMKRLIQLDLSTNNIGDYSNFRYPDILLGHLTALTNLHIDGVSNKTFGPGFKNLTSLNTLDLSGTPTFQYISRDMFDSFCDISLKTLSLCSCDLRWIHPEAFSSLPDIESIDMSYNTGLELNNAGNSAYGLRNTTIRKLILRSIHTGTDFTRLTGEDLINIRHTRLEELYLEYNNIVQFDIDCIKQLPPSLHMLSLSHNNIEAYREEMYALLLLRSLRVLDASFQMTYKMVKMANWNRNRSLDRLDQHSFRNEHNDTRIVNDALLPHINVSKDGTLIFNVPPNLTVLLLSHTYKLRFPMPRLVLVNSHMQKMDLSSNQINPWVGPMEGMESITDFNLSDNDCENVYPTFFSCSTGLRRLYIGKNKLGPKLNDQTFYNLTNLEILDLSHNRLEHVTSDLFWRLTKLQCLNLSYNVVAFWEANITLLKNLSLLDLRSNRLSAPPVCLLEDLDRIGMLTNVTVTLLDNPLRCFCETEYFIQWLTDTRVLVSDLNETTCSLYNGTLRTLSEKQAILDHLKKHCRSFASVVAGLSATIVFILCVIVGGILHRYRWKLRYLYYMAVKRGERTGYQTLDGAVENLFAYDAFLSYEDADRDFIKQGLLPKLEGKEGLRLCIDRRDFTPGMYITENIMNAIENSRKTVVLLSKEFLKSKWCMYEMNMARMESLYNGRETLVIVMMEKLEARDLTAEVLEIIHSQSYIEKTDDPTGQDLFWKRLVAAIK